MKNSRNYIPDGQMVLSIMNGEPEAGEEVVRFYENYIRKMATEQVYSADREGMVSVYNEDLAQELRVSLVKSLPALRKALISRKEQE